MAYGAVYLVTNTVNGRQYVGQTTVGVRQRWTAHVRSRFVSTCRLLSRAIRKHGAGAFTVRTLGECDSRHSLNASERFAIEALGCVSPHGYNLTTGGESSYRRSSDTRNRIAAAWSPERRAEQEFMSCVEACRALGLEASAVSQCLNGKARHKRHKGYRFERLAQE